MNRNGQAKQNACFKVKWEARLCAVIADKFICGYDFLLSSLFSLLMRLWFTPARSGRTNIQRFKDRLKTIFYFPEILCSCSACTNTTRIVKKDKREQIKAQLCFVVAV